MPRIVILTPDPADEAYSSRWRDLIDSYAPLLRGAGLDVECRNWVQAGDLTGFAAVLPLLVWGYHRAGDAWAEQVASWEGQGVRLHNPASVLKWNADKTYLGRLADAGAPVVPTRFVDALSIGTMHDAAAAFGTARLVAKPQVSASAWRTIRWSPGDPVDEGPDGPAIIQPYLPSIESDGEVSLIYFSGRYSHAIRKVPQPGDFRVQPEYDGIITAHNASADERAAAETILNAVSEDLLYARIDLVRGAGGEPVLIELELIEPDLYLGHDPGRGAMFAEAVASLC